MGEVETWSMDEVTGSITRTSKYPAYKEPKIYLYESGSTEHSYVGTLSAYHHFRNNKDSTAFKNELMLMHVLCVHMYLCNKKKSIDYSDICNEDTGIYHYFKSDYIINQMTVYQIYFTEMTFGNFIKFAFDRYNELIKTYGTGNTYGSLTYWIGGDKKQFKILDKREIYGCYVDSYERYINRFAYFNLKNHSLTTFIEHTTYIIGNGPYTMMAYSGKGMKFVTLKDDGTAIRKKKKGGVRKYTISNNRRLIEYIEPMEVISNYRDRGIKIMYHYLTDEIISKPVRGDIYDKIFEPSDEDPTKWLLLYVNTPRTTNLDKLFNVFKTPVNKSVYDSENIDESYYRRIMHITFLHELGKQFNLTLHFLMYMLYDAIGDKVGRPYNRTLNPVANNILSWYEQIEPSMMDKVHVILFESLLLGIYKNLPGYNVDIKLQRATDLIKLREETRKITPNKINVAFLILIYINDNKNNKININDIISYLKYNNIPMDEIVDALDSYMVPEETRAGSLGMSLMKLD